MDQNPRAESPRPKSESLRRHGKARSSRKARKALLANDLNQSAFAAAAIEFAVEDLFPWAEVELAPGDGDHDFAAHDLAFHVGVGVVFAGAVMLVLGGRRMGSELFQPDVVIMKEAVFGVIDEDGSGDMHG